MTSAAIRAGTPLLVENLAADAGQVAAGAVLDLSRAGPAVVVPLPSADFGDDNATAGALILAWRREDAAAAQNVDLGLPTMFAEQAALAIQISHARSDRERLAVYDDRDRIGRDLHDVVIQRLFAIGLNLQSSLRRSVDADLTKRIDSAIDEIDSTIGDIRRTIFELGAMDRADARQDDVRSAVTDVVQRAVSALKFRPALTFEGPVRTQIGQAVTTDLVAVLGEALSNASRHARASQVEVVLRVDDRIRLQIRDNGRGMPEDAVESGLANIRQRAERHRGECTIEPAEPSGTVIHWSVPLT